MIRTKLDKLKKILSRPEVRQHLYWLLARIVWYLIWTYLTFYSDSMVALVNGVCGVTSTTGCQW